MSKIKTTLISFALIFAISTSAFANGLSLNSIGTKALGMGGAFVGLANDGTAIHWNPAGLAGQASSLSISYTGIMPSATYKMDYTPYGGRNIDATSESQLHHVPALFVNYSMDKWAFGLGVYVPAGLGIEWNPQDFYGPGAAGTEMMSQIGVISISPTVAYQVTDKFSLGLAVNIFYGMFDMKQPVEGAFQFDESSTGTGVGFTIGAKYDFSETFSAGATFKTSTKVAMSGDATNTLFPILPTIPPNVHPDYPNGLAPGPKESSFSRDVTWPMWIAGGIAYKPTCCLTLAFDVQYSQWSELDKLVATYDDAYWDAAMKSSGNDELHLDWEDAVQIRVGGEYMATKEVAVRLGYYYDPAPAPDETLNVLFPSSTNHVATGGFGYYADKFSVEGSLEYLFGQERDIELNAENEMPGLHQMDVFAFSIGFGYKF